VQKLEGRAIDSYYTLDMKIICL